MKYRYFKIDNKDKNKVLNFLKENNIDFEITKVLTDYLYEEDAKKILNEYLIEENIDICKDEYKDIINYIGFYLNDFDWCEYDSYIKDLIKSYFEEK